MTSRRPAGSRDGGRRTGGSGYPASRRDTTSISTEVARSEPELIGPVTTMRRRMKATFQRLGSSSYEPSIRSDGMATCDRS